MGDKDNQDDKLGSVNGKPSAKATDEGQDSKTRFEKFASTQAAGDGIEGDVLKPNKTDEEKLGANMADRK